MKKFCVTLSVLAALLISAMSGNAWAGIQPGEFSVSLMGGGYDFDDDRNLLDLGKTFSLGLGYNFNEHLGTELLFSYVHTDADNVIGDDDVYGYQGQLDLIYHLTSWQSFVPYLAMGVGGMVFDDDNVAPREIEDTIQVNGGLGLKYFFTDNVAFRADGRYYHSFEDSDNEFVVRAGIEYQFGGPKKSEPVVPEPPKDTDNDGVYDDTDKCPDTPPNVRVDSDGCQIRSEPYAVMEKSDETAEAVQESDEPEVVVVEEEVKPEMMKVVVYFESAGVNIKSLFHKRLKELAEFMKEYPQIKAVIEGHTDNRGSEGYNMDLSQRRAESVKQFLMENHGIDPSRFELKAMGESAPAEPNDTAEDRRLNRRAITITIME